MVLRSVWNLIYLATVQDSRYSGKDAVRKFGAYRGSLHGRDQKTTIVDKIAGEVPNDIATHLTDWVTIL